MESNWVKFYYEKVLGKQKEYYDIERPRKEKLLPDVLSKEEIATMLKATKNKKHKCLIETKTGKKYSATSIYNVIKNTATKAGIKKRVYHMFRKKILLNLKIHLTTNSLMMGSQYEHIPLIWTDIVNKNKRHKRNKFTCEHTHTLCPIKENCNFTKNKLI